MEKKESESKQKATEEQLDVLRNSEHDSKAKIGRCEAELNSLIKKVENMLEKNKDEKMAEVLGESLGKILVGDVLGAGVALLKAGSGLGELFLSIFGQGTHQKLMKELQVVQGLLNTVSGNLNQQTYHLEQLKQQKIEQQNQLATLQRLKDQEVTPEILKQVMEELRAVSGHFSMLRDYFAQLSSFITVLGKNRDMVDRFLRIPGLKQQLEKQLSIGEALWDNIRLLGWDAVGKLERVKEGDYKFLTLEWTDEEARNRVEDILHDMANKVIELPDGQ